MPEETPTPEPLDLKPRPKVKRLNRASLALVAIAGILILWIALWALGRKPASHSTAKPPEPTTRAIDVDRLQRTQAQPPERPRLRFGDAPSLPPPPPPAPQRTATTGTDPEAIRAQRALDASPVLAAFAKPTFYQSDVELRRSEGLPVTDSSLMSGFATSGANTGPTAPQADTGLKHRKEAFLAGSGAPKRQRVLSAQVEPPLSPFTLLEGSYLPAVLTAGITSDLPGQTTAFVRENVYDSPTGRYLLIPSGSRLLGTYDSRIAYGQKRVLVAWDRLVFPDGSSLDLGRMPGADLAGEAGVRDRVNNHFVRTFGQALLLSAFSAGAQLSQPQQSSSFGGAPSARQVATAALGQELNRTASLILRRNLDIEPTLEIRPGKLFFVQLTADLVFSGPHS